MPSLDGLELAHELRTVSPDSVVVVMSGYKEFDYARRAMKNGVLDFIVKPIEEEELFAVLDRARREIERRKADRRETVLARDPDAIKDALLAEVMVASDPVGTGARLCDFLGIHLGPFAVVCVLAAAQDRGDDHAPSVREVVEDVVRAARERGSTHVFLFQDHLVLIVMPEHPPHASRTAGPPASEVAAALSRVLRGRGRIGVSLPHQGSAQIRAACEEGLSAIEAGYYSTPGAVFFHAPAAAAVFPYPAVAQERLTACLVTGDRNATEACARDFLSPYARLRVPLKVLDEHVRGVMRHVQENLASLLPELEDLRRAAESLTPVHRHLWFDRLQAELVRVLGDLSEKVERANQSRLEQGSETRGALHRGKLSPRPAAGGGRQERGPEPELLLLLVQAGNGKKRRRVHHRVQGGEGNRASLHDKPQHLGGRIPGGIQRSEILRPHLQAEPRGDAVPLSKVRPGEVIDRKKLLQLQRT